MYVPDRPCKMRRLLEREVYCTSTFPPALFPAVLSILPLTILLCSGASRDRLMLPPPIQNVRWEFIKRRAWSSVLTDWMNPRPTEKPKIEPSALLRSRQYMASWKVSEVLRRRVYDCVTLAAKVSLFTVLG